MPGKETIKTFLQEMLEEKEPLPQTPPGSYFSFVKGYADGMQLEVCDGHTTTRVEVRSEYFVEQVVKALLGLDYQHHVEAVDLMRTLLASNVIGALE